MFVLKVPRNVTFDISWQHAYLLDADKQQRPNVPKTDWVETAAFTAAGG